MQEDLSISKAAIFDLFKILKIEKNVFPYPKKEQVIKSDVEKGRYYCLKKDKQVVGYVAFEEIASEIHILNLAVSLDLQKQGLAKKMLKFVMEKGTKFYLEVRQSNRIAKKLYTGLGFKIISTRKKYYAPNEEDALVMGLL